jgi:hypothetical protein
LNGRELKNAFNMSVERHGGDIEYDFTFQRLPDVLEFIDEIEKKKDKDRILAYKEVLKELCDRTLDGVVIHFQEPVDSDKRTDLPSPSKLEGD